MTPVPASGVALVAVWVAVLAAAGAAALLSGPVVGAVALRRSAHPVPVGGDGRPRVWAPLRTTVPAAGAVLALGGAPAVAATAAVVAWVARAFAVRRRRRREAVALAEQAWEACVVLADEVRAGRPPDRALVLAAEVLPTLRQVVAAYDLGADVPEAFRRTGVPELRLVGAAWQVAERSGAGLGDALDRVAAGLRAARTTRRVVASELASARATARLLVALPGLALVGGAGAGGRPWHFLLATPAGLGCLWLGLALAAAGLWWIEAIADDVERST